MQACEALAAAHAHGIVHRDIKPENLFLTQQAQGMHTIKVLDFGISKIALPRGKRDLVRTQMALGSPVYMSPEQIRRSDQVDARSDIWAIGCVLFELLTGVTAFDEPSLLELSAAILEREPVPLQTLCPEASDELEEIVLRCLAKNPDERYQNVAELAAALFPFGPRRARISAERCYHMLKNAGIVQAELMLASAFPPSLSSVTRLTTGSLRTTVSRTTTPAALDIVIEDEPSLRASSGRKTPLFVALGLAAAAAGGFLVLRAGGTEQATVSAATAPQRGAELSAARSAPVRLAAPVLDLDEPIVASASATSATKPKTAAKAAGANAGTRAAKAPKLARPPAVVPKRARSSDDELDPGF
jgi:serine/threonine-protein kinase